MYEYDCTECNFIVDDYIYIISIACVGIARATTTSSSSSSSSSSMKRTRIVTHSRNIRAVVFHPSGRFVFVAAPDPPIDPSARGPTAANRYSYDM